jgi:hypothetical protein
VFFFLCLLVTLPLVSKVKQSKSVCKSTVIGTEVVTEGEKEREREEKTEKKEADFNPLFPSPEEERDRPAHLLQHSP